MPDFHFKLFLPGFGSLQVGAGECLLVNTYNAELVNSVFSWLESGKYLPGASIELTSGSDIVRDRLLAGRHYSVLRFRLSGHESDDFYYQQRYNSSENDDIQTLASFMGEISDPYHVSLAQKLGLDKLTDEKINMLSTGEFRKAMIFKKAVEKPGLLFIDEPYAGLDEQSCNIISMLFDHLVGEGSSLVIFNSTSRRPSTVTAVIDAGTPESHIESATAANIAIPAPSGPVNFDYAFELKNINASYSGRAVLKDICWSVARNEKWSLTGHNGAGKSTLLSFVYADNPKAYCNDIKLFDNKRGSGETIWEIKDRIGFYSSEFHRYFNKMHYVESAIDSIVYQNPYRKRILNPGEVNFRQELMKYLDLEKVKEKKLCDLPVVTQKLVLLAGVLIKNAALLILDEPFQGFSRELVQQILPLLEGYAANRTFVMVSHSNSDFPPCISRHYHIDNGMGREIPIAVD